MTDTLTIEPTRECCQNLYLRGYDWQYISKQTGVKPTTVRTWVHRYGWDAIRQKLTGTVEQTVTTPILTSSVEKASTKVRDLLSKELEETCEQLAKVKQSPSVPKLRARQEVLTRVVQCANKVFGWDQQSSSTVASVQSLSSDLPDASKPTTDTVPIRSLAPHNSSDTPPIDTQVSQPASVSLDSPN